PYDEASAACIGCGSCAEICPTGAIEMKQTGNQRVIWDKTFELVSCSNCGKPFATTEEIQYVANKTGMDCDIKLCDSCRKKELAVKLSQFSS
ncbi:MAG: 4Fe-4S binding protein, partial [Syntrophomonas sp.]